MIDDRERKYIVVSKYIIRLDDACEKRNVANWDKIEDLLDAYSVKPLVGVIPDCKDPMMEQYPIDCDFWNRVHAWEEKGWTIAMHGYQHLYTTKCGGINPVNSRSEFAGETIEVQREKIRSGVAIMQSHGINPNVFFAPSHTLDENTIEALKSESEIRIISDTVAADVYSEYGMTFVPQQSGRVRNLPFRTVTFCYHPNTMNEKDFKGLEDFIKSYRKRFVPFNVDYSNRNKSVMDFVLNKIYFMIHH